VNKPKRLPPPRLDAYEWQDRGACRSVAVEVFFDSDQLRGALRAQREEAAKRVCRRCPVILQCRVHAMAAEDYGVWGGLTARERAERRTAAAVAQAS
jgi:WhiB family redox-sensing transcriptional regulator